MKAETTAGAQGAMRDTDLHSSGLDLASSVQR